jgi:catechol 2,3-dioxygenase-like lactoylglutathione lyase family enzyme
MLPCFFVTDMRRSLEFYLDVLGFTQTGYYPIASDPVRTEVRRDSSAAPAPSLRDTVAQSISRDSELNRLDSELRAAAELILQDVIDDFVPQIEAELKRRLQARLSRLLPQRK